MKIFDTNRLKPILDRLQKQEREPKPFTLDLEILNLDKLPQILEL